MIEDLKIAIGHRSTGDFGKAESLFKELLNDHPEDPSVYYHYAWLCDNMEREIEAIPLYEKAIALKLDDEELPDCYLGLGSTLRSVGQYKEAKIIFQEGMKLFPEREDLKLFNAMNAYNLGEYQNSTQSLLEIIGQFVQEPQIAKYRKSILKYAKDLNRLYD